MKYDKSGTGVFTTQQFSIEETITETKDVVLIALHTLQNITVVSEDVKKELNLAISNLNQATDYLKYIKSKTDIALKYVPSDVQEKEFL